MTARPTAAAAASTIQALESLAAALACLPGLGLPFALVSDATGSVCERYGVWKEKKLYGRTFMGIERSTFLIDANGIVRNIWRKVRVPGHVTEVLGAVNAL